MLPVVFPGLSDACEDHAALISASTLDMVDQIIIRLSSGDEYGDERQRAI